MSQGEKSPSQGACQNPASEHTGMGQLALPHLAGEHAHVEQRKQHPKRRNRSAKHHDIVAEGAAGRRDAAARCQTDFSRYSLQLITEAEVSLFNLRWR
jgi:hypothetical protein